VVLNVPTSRLSWLNSVLLLVAGSVSLAALAAQDPLLCPLASDRLERSVALTGSADALRAPQTELEIAAAREARSARSRQALQGTFEAELARQSRPDAIAGNVMTLLADADADASRPAMQWLVVVGAPALPQLHAALADRATSDSQKLRLLAAISEIGSTESIGPLLKMARSRADGLLYAPIFQVLARIEPTQETIAFARDQLGSNIAPVWRAAALVYLGRIRYQPAAPNVDTYTTVLEMPATVRVAGLYLGARLGVAEVLGRIEAALIQATHPLERETLLESLGEAAASTGQFTRIARAAGFSERDGSYRQDLAYCAFRTSSAAHKVELAYALLADGRPAQRRVAMRYLIDNDRAALASRVTGGAGSVMPLHMLMPRSGTVRMLFSEGRRMGYALEHTGTAYVLRKI
jgi:hypothetical protein